MIEIKWVIGVLGQTDSLTPETWAFPETPGYWRLARTVFLLFEGLLRLNVLKKDDTVQWERRQGEFGPRTPSPCPELEW